MIPGDLLSAFPHRQFHTLPGLLDSWAALPNSNPNACMPMQGGSLYHFYDGLWYDPAERRTHDNMMIYDAVIYVNWIALRFTANTRTLCILTELSMSPVIYFKLQ